MNRSGIDYIQQLLGITEPVDIFAPLIELQRRLILAGLVERSGLVWQVVTRRDQLDWQFECTCDGITRFTQSLDARNRFTIPDCISMVYEHWKMEELRLHQKLLDDLAERKKK